MSILTAIIGGLAWCAICYLIVKILISVYTKND